MRSGMLKITSLRDQFIMLDALEDSKSGKLQAATIICLSHPEFQYQRRERMASFEIVQYIYIIIFGCSMKLEDFL